MSNDYPRPGINTQAAMRAAKNLEVWGVIVSVAETAGERGRAAQRVIKIAKDEMQRELRNMDRAVGKINEGKP
jgi:hypothetical protein